MASACTQVPTWRYFLRPVSAVGEISRQETPPSSFVIFVFCGFLGLLSFQLRPPSTKEDNLTADGIQMTFAITVHAEGRWNGWAKSLNVEMYPSKAEARRRLSVTEPKWDKLQNNSGLRSLAAFELRQCVHTLWWGIINKRWKPKIFFLLTTRLFFFLKNESLSNQMRAN